MGCGNSRLCQSCGDFWGPWRPLVGDHSPVETSTSACFPPLVVVAWRGVFFLFFLASSIFFMVQDNYSLKFFTIWSYLLLSIAVAFLTLSSALHAFNIDLGPNSVFVCSSVILFQTAATAALFLDIIYWMLLYDNKSPDFTQLAQHALNLCFVILDMSLCLRINFRVFYILFFVSFILLYIIFSWIRFAIVGNWPYDFLDYRNQVAGITVAYYFGLFAWAAIAAALMVMFSRLNRLPCVKSRVQERNEYEVV